jgi:hypothetical protein
MRICPLVLASPARLRNGSVNLANNKLPKVMAGLIYLGIRREPTIPEHAGMRSPSSARALGPTPFGVVDHAVLLFFDRCHCCFLIVVFGDISIARCRAMLKN